MSQRDLVQEAERLWQAWVDRRDDSLGPAWCRDAGSFLEALVEELAICEACGSPLGVRLRLGMALDHRAPAWLCHRCVSGEDAAQRARGMMLERQAVARYAMAGFR